MTKTQLLLYEPHKGYRADNLIIPRKSLNEKMLEQALTFQIGETWEVDDMNVRTGRLVPKYLRLMGKNKNHLIIPRNFPALWGKDFVNGTKIEQYRPNYKKIVYPDNITLRPTQARAIKHMLRHRSGTVQLACGRGKTVLALHYIVKRQMPAIVIVNQTGLLDQWIEQIHQHIDPNLRVGVIQGSSNDWDAPIVLATVQTLAKRRSELPQQFREQFGITFYDECHHMSAPYFSRTADLFYGDRFGLTATARRTDNLEAIYMAHLGPIIYKDLTQDLIPNCTFHLLNWAPSEKQRQESVDKTGKTHHRKLCSMFGKVAVRNYFIMQNVQEDINNGRMVLVLAHSIDGVRELFYQWPGTNAGLITGKDGAKRGRIKVLRECNPVFATFELAREALDKKHLDSLHLTTPFQSPFDLQQSVGRIQRTAEGKQTPTAHFYEDKNFPLSRRQSAELRKYLTALGYPYKIRESRIDGLDAKNR